MSILYRYYIFFLSILVNFLLSVSAPPYIYKVNQPDGFEIPVKMFGHEYYNWIETDDGYVIDWVKDDNKRGWFYSLLNDEGRYTPSSIYVQYPAPADLSIPKKLKENSPQIRKFSQNLSTFQQNHHQLHLLCYYKPRELMQYYLIRLYHI